MMNVTAVCTLFFAMLMALPAHAETVREAVDRQSKQAEIDRKLIPAYSISMEALKSGREFPAMPKNVIKAAREGYSSARVGKSKVELKKVGSFMTFTIVPSASTEPDERGATHFTWQLDPIDGLIRWVHGAHSKGIVFAKGKKTSMAVPGFMTCMGISSRGVDHDSSLSEACKRFGLGKDIENVHRWKNAEDRASETEFHAFLMSNYGSDGVLMRGKLEKELYSQMERIDHLIEKSEEKTGYITYSRELGTFQAKTGHFLVADLHESDSSIRPNGRVRICVSVYSETVAKIQVELKYEDGTGVDETALGNIAKVLIAKDSLVRPEHSVRGFDIITFSLPSDLKPGKILVVASAVDATDKLIVKNESIASFQHPFK